MSSSDLRSAIKKAIALGEILPEGEAVLTYARR